MQFDFRFKFNKYSTAVHTSESWAARKSDKMCSGANFRAPCYNPFALGDRAFGRRHKYCRYCLRMTFSPRRGLCLDGQFKEPMSSLLKSLLHRLRLRRTAPVPTMHLQKASVEQIWSTWRFEKLGSDSPTRKPSSDPPIRKPNPNPSIRKNIRLELKASSNRVQNRPASVAERVTQLQRLGEYEKALGLALREIAREEEQQQRTISGERQTVPWYYWEAAIILRRLKRFDEEIALIRRFTRNYDIHFRSFSRRHRSMRSARDAWAANFLGRLEEARAAAQERKETKS